MLLMSRTGTASVVDDRTTRNLSQGGFGMAIRHTEKIGVKIERELYEMVQEYAEKNEMDTSKVTRLALKNFLGFQKSPNIKKEYKK